MASRDYPSADSDASSPSWRDLLRALTSAPSAVATIPAISPWSDVLAPLHRNYGDDPVIVVRTKGRHIGLLLQVLLDRVHGVIGHLRPKDCHQGGREVRS